MSCNYCGYPIRYHLDVTTYKNKKYHRQCLENLIQSKRIKKICTPFHPADLQEIAEQENWI